VQEKSKMYRNVTNELSPFSCTITIFGGTPYLGKYEIPSVFIS
jgi:hypothetical protein